MSDRPTDPVTGGTSSPSVFERVEEDRGRGDLWLARQRLRSLLMAKGYDPQVLAVLGEIAMEMHDAYEAGRMWLVSDASGEVVDRAMETFRRYAGKAPEQVVSQVPSYIRRRSFDRLHPVAQDRLRRLGLEEAWRAASREKVSTPAPTPLLAKLLLALCLLALLWGIVAICIGTEQMVRWLLRRF